MGRQKKFTANAPEIKETKQPKEVAEEKKVVEEIVPEEKPEEVIVNEPEETGEVEVDAVVDGVKMNLNIRSNPKVEPNNQIAILGKGTKLIVMSPEKPVEKNGEAWYKVRLRKDDPTVGYAMKKYIKIL